MPNSFRIKTEIGINKVLPIKLDQQFDTLEILSLAVFPNDIYTRSCADFGVLCGRVFANRGFGITNARVSVFIPLDELDENNAIISTLYPYKRTEDFNEDGYKYNLLPYTQSHSGHVPVGTFPERLDALTNQSVIEVYDKYYKFTAKTNESGDFMIFGLPIGQHNIFMQVDLSDIGEFSLTPQDLVRMGRATETQIDGVKFKFSENYSELPQIVTIEKTIQVAPFYGEKDICEHYIVRTDFDLTSEAGVEFKPTSVFMGSIISHNNRKKLKKRCKVPAKAGWLCEMITGPGQIEAIRQTIFKDSNGNPILEEFTLENSGKVIDENGTWVLEVPMNLDYVYTNEDGKRVLSDNPKLGVPTKGKYRFKVKWNQSPRVGEENKRGYFLVPNVKEWGWEESDSENKGNSVTNTNWNITSPTRFIGDLTFSYDADEPPATGPRVVTLSSSLFSYFAVAFQSSINVDNFKILVNDGSGNFVENPDYKNYIPIDTLSFNDIRIEFTAIDPNSESYFTYRVLNEAQYKQECSYTFSVNWADYGTPDMINEAINCEDRFYQMSYNKVYTVSQLIDRFAWQTFPQKAIEIKHITENKCEGDYNPFPANDVYYRYDIMFLILSFLMNFIIQPVLIAVIVIFHVLAWLFNLFLQFYPAFCRIRNIVIRFKCKIHNITFLGISPFRGVTCDPEVDCSQLPVNPFLNMRLGVFLYTDDGCERCKCNISELAIPNDAVANELASYNVEFGNTSVMPDFTTTGTYQIPNLIDFTPTGIDDSSANFYSFIPQIMAGGSGNLYDFLDQNNNPLTQEQKEATFLLPYATDALYGGQVFQFSTSLTLGERLNLFNTKAKYYDGTGDINFSPGDTGWSQIKVTWWPELNYTYDVGEIDLITLNSYTTTINGENVWIMYGDNTFLSDQIIYLYNNPGQTPIFPYSTAIQVLVTETFFVDTDLPPNLADNFTILTFSSSTSDNLVAPVTPTTNFQPDLSITTSDNPNDETEEIYWVLKTIPSDYTAFLDSIIYLSNNSNTQPVIYYKSDFPDELITLQADTEVVITNQSPYINAQGLTQGLKVTLRLPTGEIIIPWKTGYKYNFRITKNLRFAWSTTPPNSIYDTFHFDNVLAILIEDNSIKTGDLLTFQSPSLSQDPNVGKPIGQLNETIGGNNNIEVRFARANPSMSCSSYINNQPWNCATTYVTPVIERTPWVSPFPRDLEYFQAVSVIPFSAMTENRAPLDVTGDNRFSLPWRFLDSSYTKSVSTKSFTQQFTFGCYSTTGNYDIAANSSWDRYSFILQGPGQESITLTQTLGQLIHEKATYRYGRPDGVISYFPPFPGERYTNDFRIFRNQRDPIGDTSSYTGLGGYNDLLDKNVVEYSPFTRAFQLASPPNCADTNAGMIGGTTNIWSTVDTSRYKIVFVQRGVDPHSPKLKVRYDLSRLYGYEDYDANNGQFIIEGEYRMNIPIQGTGSYGLKLPGHCVFNNNYDTSSDGQRIFFRSYLYSDNAAKYSGDWTTNLHTYYSCLDAKAVEYENLWSVPNPIGTSSVLGDSITTPNSNPDFSILQNFHAVNLFSSTFEIKEESYTITDQGTYQTSLGFDLNGTTVLAPCQASIACTSNTEFGEYGLGYDRNHFVDIPPLEPKYNHEVNNVSGYWWNEYIEGGSFMTSRLETSGPNRPGFIGGMKYYYYVNIPFIAGTTFPLLTDNSITPSIYSTCNSCSIPKREVYPTRFRYFSPTYRTIPYVNNDGYLQWSNSAHTISMSSNDFIVFRTDRLPTSTTVTQYGPNGFLMAQNNTFSIYVFNNEGISTQQGGYELPDQAQGAEIDLNELPAENQAIIDSLVTCELAVNLNSYDVDNVGNPYIKPNDPFSIKGAETYFVRGMGCYNFVSVPFGSLRGVPSRTNGGGGDIASAVEWTRRTILNFSLCFEIYSHTFSNNWINGTLYHYPFQLNTVFGPDNEPVRDYCRHVIYFHEPNQTFYYRSSPWNGSDFIGKTNPGRMLDTRYGNDKLLMYPTTIMDMGPKTSYLQELVFSDEYDGYIVSKIPTTTFQNVTDLLNIFVLSRLVNTNFLQQLIPTNASGNNEGSDDPSVTGFFKNTRWANGEAFFRNLLPSIVDADYAQMLSINSEFGVKEYGPEVYRNTDIFFVNDNNGNSVFGITLDSSNQDRDYISPRRTIWNDNAAVPAPDGDFTYIPTSSQKVPDYQWRLRYQFSNTAEDPLQYPTIFGMQSNDFWTNAPDPSANDSGTPGASTIFSNGFFYSKYQKLDRFDDFSEYFKTDISNITKYYKAHIINYKTLLDAAGNVVVDSLGNVTYTETANAPDSSNRRYAYTFGAPFHFYFGLIQGASAMDRFRTKYVDTNITYE